MFRIGVDVGGTFTDGVAEDPESGTIVSHKVLTTSPDPSLGVLSAVRALLERLGMSPDAVASIVHSTTIAANAIIERKGAVTALVTTAGFRDILETRTEKRYDVYDFNAELPAPLVPRQRRMGVTERMDESGNVVVPFEQREAEQVVRELLADHVESVAVCFLHSYRNPGHERSMLGVLERMAPGLAVSVSSDVAPQIREYPRLSTTVADAYIRPLVKRYVEATERSLREMGFGRFSYMMVSGAVVTSDVAKRAPIRLIDSGPSAAAMAAAYIATLMRRPQVISLEMGGTTAKICFVDDGLPSYTNEFEVSRVDRFRKGSGLPITLPAVDLVEIGAGGGSIAWVDEMGLLRVGPRSAGAAPGPACYGLGGGEPTVTDADLILGYLNPHYFLGGRMSLRPEAAKAAISRVARPLGFDDEAAAWGIHEVVIENMANAAREYVAEKGRDVRNHTLIAAGGSGPTHAVAIARRLGLREVIVPWGAGVLSAIGSLASPLGFDFVQTYVARLGDIDWDPINEVLGELETRATALLRDAGIDEREMRLIRACDMRYVGQTHEIRVPIPAGRLTAAAGEEIARRYQEEYERLYSHPNVGYEVECINWRVFARGPTPSVRLPTFTEGGRGKPDAAKKGTRRAYFAEGGAYVDCAVYERGRLLDNAEVRGPAMIEEGETTIVLPPRSLARTDAHLNLTITV